MASILAFALIWWLGLYLVSRDIRSPVLRYAGLGCLCFALSLSVDHLNQFDANLATLRQLLALFPSIFWVMTAAILWREVHSQPISRRVIGVILFGLIGLFLETGLVLIPVLPRDLVLSAMCFDVVLLAAIIAYLDAFNLGESLLPHMMRSFDASILIALIFGVQIGLAVLATGVSLPLLVAPYAVVGTAIFVQVFQPQMQGLFDRIAFADVPDLRRARANLRETEKALPRTPPEPDLAALDQGEFIRLTRRALTHISDLPRLAASPLIHLPQMELRLAARGVSDDLIARATELRALLLESIQRLKPPNDGEFGTSHEWRHFNALYFPYVLGVKPYSTRLNADNGDPRLQPILEWFRTQVPERTLYNWQNAAARLVAQDLRAKMN